MYMRRVLSLGAVLAACTFSGAASPQRNVAEPLVIEGATIIDGTGSPPLTDRTIVIQDKRILQIGPAGQTRIPAGAKVVNAKGKFVIPGLIDSHVHYYGWDAELILNHGVTTIMDVGNFPPWIKAQREMIRNGDVPGPRIFFAGYLIAGGSYHSHARHARNSEEAIAMTREEIVLYGVDFVKLHSEATPEIARAVCAEAHRQGRHCISHLTEAMDARQAVLAGVDMPVHTGELPAATIQSDDLRRQARQKPILGGAPFMQWELFADLINLMIKHNVYYEPDLANGTRGLHPLSEQFAFENLVLTSNPGLSYIPDNPRRRWFATYPAYSGILADKGGTRVGVPDSDKELFRRGYENLTLFLREFVKAGGKLMVATDSQHNVIPGLAMHQEMELLVHAGILSPLQAIVSATRIPAEFLGKLQEFGTVEQDKLADLVVLNSDPLQDIRNTRDIAEVVQEGRLVDRTYHRYFTNPLPRPILDYGGENPSPQIQSFTPEFISCRGGNPVLDIRGTGFIQQSFVKINGVGQDMEFVSDTEIKTKVDCTKVTSPGTFELVVVNPKPICNGCSKPWVYQGSNASESSNAIRFVVDR